VGRRRSVAYRAAALRRVLAGGAGAAAEDTYCIASVGARAHQWSWCVAVGGFGVWVGEDLGEGGNFRPLPSETDRIGPPG